MRFAVGILIEGRYAEGAAALVNSLWRWGFDGTVFVGVRGRLPDWLNHGAARQAGRGPRLVAVPVAEPGALTWLKPRFLLDLLDDAALELDGLYYFDADVVLVGPWRIFESWAANGIAVCADVNPEMPAGHPFRHAWREIFDPAGRLPVRALETYFNAGFCGLPRRLRGFLECWRDFNDVARRRLAEPAWSYPAGARHPLSAGDQDSFNAALMLGDAPLSPMGRDGMGFQWGGGSFVMAHAIGEQKPWATCLTAQAIRRRRPNLASRAFVENLEGPVRVYSAGRRFLHRTDLAVARAIGALVGS